MIIMGILNIILIYLDNSVMLHNKKGLNMKKTIFITLALFLGVTINSNAYATNDSIVFNDDIIADTKIDGKTHPLENKDEIEFLNSIFENNSEYLIKNINEILVKSDSDIYDKRLYLDGYLKKPKDDNKEIYFMVSKDKIYIDYNLGSDKKSRISGVDVYLSKAEDLNIDTQILLRAIFKVDKYNILLEAENIESREFLFYLENVINNVNTAVNKDKNLNNDEIEKYTKLSQAVKEAQLTIDAAKYLINNTPETIKSVRKELDLLIEKSENLIMKANKILQNIGMTDL